MKKLLALVLALVMSMSLVTISNAAFDDAAEIDLTESVEVLAAVGVLVGSDGKFSPKAELTRSQACKIIAYLDLGKDIADALPALQVFNDVPADNWAAKYVAYCADAGYVSGVGNGNFDPNGKLTGYQFGKMLLCVLGYDATIEQFTGSSWEISVAKKMKSLELADGVDKVGSAVLTREEAAQYALNALETTTVEYDDKGTVIEGNGLTITTGAKSAKEVTAKVKTSQNVYAVSISGESVDSTETDRTVQLGEKLYDGDLTKKSADVTDDFGRVAHTWYWKGTTSKYEVGTYADKAAYTFVVSSTKDTANVLAVIDELGADVADDFNKTSAKNAAVKVGDTIEFYTTDGKITYYNIFKTQLAKVTKVSAASKDADYDYTVTLKTNSTTKSYKDTALTGFDAATMTKDTYVTYTTVAGKAGVMVAVADKVSGKNTGAAATYVKVDGAKKTFNGTNVWKVDDFDGDYTNTFDFYLDANGYVIGSVKTSDINTIENIFYVAEANFDAGTTFADKKAQLNVYYLDGTNKIVNMVIDSDKKVNIGGTKTALPAHATPGDLSVSGKFYAYTTDGDEIAKITAIAEGVVKNTAQLVDADKDVVLLEKSPVVEIGGTKYYASADTKIVLIDKDGKVTTHTGYSKLPAATYTTGTPASGELAAKGYLYVADKTSLKELYIVGVTTRVGAVDTTVYGYFVKNDGNVYNAEEKYLETTLIFNVDGKDTEYLIKTSDLALSYEGLYALEVKDGYVDADAITSTVNKAIQSTGDGYVVISDVKKLADDCVIYDATDAEAIVEITEDELNDGDIISYTLNGDSKINRIYVSYAAQDDGIVVGEKTEAYKAYLDDVLGYDADDAAYHAGLGKDGILVKYTVTEAVSGNVSVTVKNTETDALVATYDPVVSGVSYAKDSTHSIMLDLKNDYPSTNVYPVGDYEITVKVGATEVAVYTFSVGA